MKQTGLGKAIRSPLPFLLTMAFAALICVHLRAQTCTVTANGLATDSFFNAEYTENGLGTRNEPSGRPGWTGADSTYSVLLPSGDTAFFFLTPTLACTRP